MRAAVYRGPGRIAVESREVPRPGPSDLLIRVKACGVCGTDVHILDDEFPAPPGIALGHEYTGVVTEVGREVNGFAPGDSVAVDPNIACQMCHACRRGDVHLCEKLEALGVTRDGGFAELCALPATQAYHLPPGLSLEESVLLEPLSCCLHGLDLANVRPGDRVAILGAGPIGLLMTQLVRNAGASYVLVSDPIPDKRTLAARLGADEVVDPKTIPLGDALRRRAPEGADAVLECVGAPATAAQALDLARRGGTVVWFGVNPPGATIPVEPYAIYRKELTIRAAFVNPHTFARAIHLLTQGRVQGAPLISHRFDLAGVAEAIATVKAGRAIKALVLP